jgi:alkylation response protein AidB-like acyl-CoA dehydrogenase
VTACPSTLHQPNVRCRKRARELAQGPIADRAAEIDRSEQYPWDNVALLKEGGFFGMTIHTAYGGQSASYLDALLVITPTTYLPAASWRKPQVRNTCCLLTRM